MRGPETKATPADCPAEGEWLGIRFKLGTFMPGFTPGDLKDRHDVTLPDATSRSFWLNGSAWEYPDFENAETFVARLVRKGIIVRDAAVEAALEGQPGRLPIRSAQRHFLRATGITHRTVRQIERARYATTLLKQGVSILDTVLRRRLFRSGASHPIVEDADRPDTGGDHARRTAAVVSIQNNAAAGSLRCAWEV